MAENVVEVAIFASWGGIVTDIYRFKLPGQKTCFKGQRASYYRLLCFLMYRDTI